MKLLLILMSLIIFSCQDSKTAKSNDASETSAKVAESEVIDGLPEDEEDCDDKFEKAQEEKKIDENNLFGQNSEADEGCTIE